MKETIKSMYQCDHCKKWYHRKHACIYHEKLCFKNPINERPCFDCPNLVSVEYTLYDDHPNLGEVKRDVIIFQCSETKNYLHTPQNAIKGNAYELGDHENLPMPVKCDIYDKGLEFNKQFWDKFGIH